MPKKLNIEPLTIEYIEDKHDETRDFQASFWFENRRYYLSDFIRCHNNPWISDNYPEYIHAFEADNYINPLYISVDESGDFLDVYRD